MSEPGAALAPSPTGSRSKLKNWLARQAARGARAALPWLPERGRGLIWDQLLAPHLWWRGFEFEVRAGGGVRFRGNTADPIQKYIYYFGTWEPNLTAWLQRRLRRGDCFVDVGANTGYFSLLASRLVGVEGQVVAIEAMPATFARLQRNLALNRAGNVRALAAAVAETECELQFFAPAGQDSGRVTAAAGWAADRQFRPTARIAARPLPDILSGGVLERARMMKIDVEGLEMQVLRTLLPRLQDCQPELEIVVEVTPAANDGAGHLAVLQQFQAAGFHVYELANDYDPRSYISTRPIAAQRRRDLNFPEQRDLILSRVDAERL